MIVVHSFTRAAPNADYFQFAIPPVLTFTAGSSVTDDSSTSSSQCFSVPIIDDQLLDPNETFDLGLDNPGGLIVIDNSRVDSQTTVEIIDNDVGESICRSTRTYIHTHTHRVLLTYTHPWCFARCVLICFSIDHPYIHDCDMYYTYNLSYPACWCISGAVVGFSMITYQGDEGVALEVCARILSLVGGTALSSDVAVSVSTSSDQATATGIF